MKYTFWKSLLFNASFHPDLRVSELHHRCEKCGMLRIACTLRRRKRNCLFVEHSNKKRNQNPAQARVAFICLFANYHFCVSATNACVDFSN